MCSLKKGQLSNGENGANGTVPIEPLSWPGSSEANPGTRVDRKMLSRKCPQEKLEGAWDQGRKGSRGNFDSAPWGALARISPTTQSGLRKRECLHCTPVRHW